MAIGPLSEMHFEPGGAVTITGDFTNCGVVSIGSALASSGSLIVNGTASGNITYNRKYYYLANSTGSPSGYELSETHIQRRKKLEQSLSDGELNTIELPVGQGGVVMEKVTSGNVLITRKLALN